MSDGAKLGDIRARIKDNQDKFDRELHDEIRGDSAWHMVSKQTNSSNKNIFDDDKLRFVGKNLENGKFAGEDLRGANFSVANLTGVDFSGANLTEANLSGADLSGAILSGSVLHRTNFTKAKLHGVKFIDADLEDVILLDIDIDVIGIEELQSLIEYLAKYYPHKLNLSKINLTMLNLAKIDLSKLNLRGVDFSGVDFTGVSLVGLDLSETNITPEQIAQALGRVPGKEELARIMAPKKKKNNSFNGLDMTELFLGNGREFGVLDFSKDKGVSIDTLLKMGKKVFGSGKKPEVKDEKALENAKSEQELKAKSHNEELRKIIEERKQKELAARKAMKENVENEQQKNKEKVVPVRDMSRGR